MGFDWEYLLSAEGEDLQAAYDDLCDDWPSSPNNDDLYWEDERWETPSAPALHGSVPVCLRGTRAAGEIILARSEPFRANRLRLYRRAVIAGQYLDYVVARRDTPVLAVAETDAVYASCAETNIGIPLLRLPRSSMEQDGPLEVISQLDTILTGRRGRCAPSPYRVEPVPAGLHAKMAELGMIQPREGPFWEPAPYGRSLGLMDGYLPPDGEAGCCHTLFITSEHRPRLDEALAFGQWSADAPAFKLPWEQTLQRARQGLPRSDIYAAGIARAVASMSLADYMASSPEALDQLCREFKLDRTATYQEAADRVFQFCADQGGSLQYRSRCMDLISALIKPIILVYTAMLEKSLV